MNIDLQAIWVDYVMPWSINAAVALLVFIVGRIFARWISSLVEKRMRKLNLDEMLVRLTKNTIYYVLIAVVIFAALDRLGVNTTSALAALGAIGLAVGLAVKDSLSNFVAGVMVALFQPFKLGHYVEAAGTSGTVMDVGMFNTTLLTPDNKRVIVPNRLIYNDTIVNYSAEDTRRVDMVFGISYEDDIAKARKLIESTMAGDKRILQEPASTVAVNELADSSVNFVVRPWVKKEDYWDVRFAMMEQIKLVFDKNGISIPYPQQDVHMHEVAES
jgi:small conductance mechanosensitive channel